jgi:hypothetical protein
LIHAVSTCCDDSRVRSALSTDRRGQACTRDKAAVDEEELKRPGVVAVLEAGDQAFQLRGAASEQVIARSRKLNLEGSVRQLMFHGTQGGGQLSAKQVAETALE